MLGCSLPAKRPERSVRVNISIRPVILICLNLPPPSQINFSNWSYAQVRNYGMFHLRHIVGSKEDVERFESAQNWNPVMWLVHGIDIMW